LERIKQSRWRASALLLLVCGCSQNPPKTADTPQASPGTASAPALYQDVTAKSGIRFTHQSGLPETYLFLQTIGGGCAFLDYDNDGRLDLLAVSGGSFPPEGKSQNLSLWHNRGDGTFEDVTKRSGLDTALGYGQACAAADFDNDGRPDLYVTAYGGCRLFRNETPPGSASPRFVDITRAAGVGDTEKGPRWASGAAWGDYDNDGRLDLYVCHYAKWSPETDKKCPRPDGSVGYCVPTVYDGDVGTLYHNMGSGRFENVTARSGIDRASGRGLACAWVDADGDGLQDIYIANDLNPNLLFRNLGNGTFREMGMEMGIALGANGAAASGMGIAAGDFTNTGAESLLVTNLHGEGFSLFENLGRGQYSYASQQTGLFAFTLPLSGWGCAFLDFDLDGRLDVVTSNGSVHEVVTRDMTGLEYREPRSLFHNTGSGRFEDWTQRGGGLAVPRAGRGLAVGDFDNDGRPDILAIGRDEPLELFRNVGSGGGWIGFRLEGTRCNRDGIGAVVRIKTSSGEQLRVCRSGGSYASSSDTRLLFGLGDSTLESVTVTWLGGNAQTLKNLAPGRYYRVKQGGSAEPEPRGASRAP
jgi:hypothetical protein